MMQQDHAQHAPDVAVKADDEVSTGPADNSELSTCDSDGKGDKILEEEPDRHQTIMYVAFVFVGASCGWFVFDGIYQLMANEKEVQRGGQMYADLNIAAGCGGFATAIAYLILIVCKPSGFDFRSGQVIVTIIAVLTILTLATLAAFWQVGAPDYIVVIICAVFSCIVSNCTFFFVFPVVVTYYGGWLVAPVRAGTDMSNLVTTLLAEAQNPTGSRNLFPSWLLFAVYCFISFLGLTAWLCIVFFRLGLGSKEEVAALDKEAMKAGEIAINADGGPAVRHPRLYRAMLALKRYLRGLACPKDLLVPVFFALMVEVLQWCVLAPVAEVIGSRTDPEGCQGERARFVYRTALTLNRAALPLASLASSVAWCPRCLFNCLALLQITSSAVILSIATDLARDFWMTVAGQTLFVILYALVGGLEGYVLTMAYRYIGDTPGMTPAMKKSASGLLSFLTVFFLNPVGVAMGFIIKTGAFECIDP